MNKSTAITILACLTACSSGLTKYDAEEQVKKLLRDPDSAEFTNIEIHIIPENGNRVACGYVNARNGFGGMTGLKRFVSGGTTIIEEDSEISVQVVDGAWNKFCLPSTLL